MFDEVKKAIGANWFRAFVVAFGCLWVWHSFFSSVGEQADATIKQATAQQALRRQKAEADEAEARAREAQVRAEVANFRPPTFHPPTATAPDEWTPQIAARREVLRQKLVSQGRLSPAEDAEHRRLLLIVLKHIEAEAEKEKR